MGCAVPAGTYAWNIPGHSVLPSTEVPVGTTTLLIKVPNSNNTMDYFSFLDRSEKRHF